MYKQIKYRLGDTIEVEEHHDGQYGAPGQKRQPKTKPTKMQMAMKNQKNKENTARRKLRMHFRVEDYFTRLSYRVDERPPDMNTAKNDFGKFIRKVRAEYKKRGYELKWIRNIEVGTKNAWHVHLVVNRIPDTDLILSRAWKNGAIHNQLIYDQGFVKLAAYKNQLRLLKGRRAVKEKGSKTCVFRLLALCHIPAGKSAAV